ncbi:MAG: rhomboid family intramembrane serine protease, partial [Taibaiella sp.]|nr:rhomboid family intramembrane serine protease [Taibaiella sp.]
MKEYMSAIIKQIILFRRRLPVNWLDKLEKRFRHFGVRGLMNYIIGLNAIVFFMIKVAPAFLYIIALIPELVIKGEVWRLVTYLFIPPASSPILLIFVLYFYYMIGSSLEHEWGTFKFNVYYLIGMIGTTAAVFITGGIATSVYLNLSLFLAFAYIFPNYQILLFFFFPIKVKYLAYLDAAFIIYSILTERLPGKVAAIVSIMNFLLFFGKDIFIRLKRGRKNYQRRRGYVVQFPKDYTVHKC